MSWKKLATKQTTGSILSESQENVISRFWIEPVQLQLTQHRKCSYLNCRITQYQSDQVTLYIPLLFIMDINTHNTKISTKIIIPIIRRIIRIRITTETPKFNGEDIMSINP